jgi:hypothetical protein
LDKTTNGIFSRRGIMQDDTGSAPQKRERLRGILLFILRYCETITKVTRGS